MLLPLLTLIGVISASLDPDFCVEKANGVYASNQCSSNYIECTDGQLKNKDCPDELFFDSDRRQCDYKESIDECQVMKEPSCDDRDDGNYAFGCTNSFFTCSNGRLKNTTCQNDLYYDIDRNTCDHKWRVVSCGGNPENEQEPQTRPPLGVPTYSPPTMLHTLKINGDIAKPDCAGKDSGSYSISPCNSKYLMCIDGVSQHATCSSDMVFNGETCVAITSVPECNVQEQSSSSVPLPEQPLPEQPVAMLASQVSVESSSLPSVTILNPFIDCDVMGDGVFANGCSSEYIICNNGETIISTCPDGLVFIAETGYCDYSNKCTQPAVSQDSFQNPSPFASSELSSSAFDCSGRLDGAYAASICSSEFHQCTNGVASLQMCPSGLIFIESLGYCDYSVKCNQENPVPAASPVIQDSLRDCSTKQNGAYSLGCIAEFYQCSNGQALPSFCPAGLVFILDLQRCDQPEFCNRERPIEALSATIAPVAPVVPIFQCTGITEEKSFSNGCVQEYITCYQEEAFHGKCPENLVFNQAQQYCDFPSNCHSTVDQITVPSQDMPSTTQQATTPTPKFFSNIDCTMEDDGVYSIGCVGQFVKCSGGAQHVYDCPANLVFNADTGSCDYTCGSSGTTNTPSRDSQRFYPDNTRMTDSTTDAYTAVYQETTAPTTSAPTTRYQPETTRYQPETTTVLETTPAATTTPTATTEATTITVLTNTFPSDVPDTTQAPVTSTQALCIENQIVALGDCSSKFARCKNGRLVNALCPGQSVFDTSISICVYDLPRCKTSLFPKPRIQLPSQYKTIYTTTSVPVITYTAAPVYPSAPVDAAPPVAAYTPYIKNRRNRYRVYQTDNGYVQSNDAPAAPYAAPAAAPTANSAPVYSAPSADVPVAQPAAAPVIAENQFFTYDAQPQADELSNPFFVPTHHHDHRRREHDYGRHHDGEYAYNDNAEVLSNPFGPRPSHIHKKSRIADSFADPWHHVKKSRTPYAARNIRTKAASQYFNGIFKGDVSPYVYDNILDIYPRSHHKHHHEHFEEEELIDVPWVTTTTAEPAGGAGLDTLDAKVEMKDNDVDHKDASPNMETLVRAADVETDSLPEPNPIDEPEGSGDQEDSEQTSRRFRRSYDYGTAASSNGYDNQGYVDEREEDIMCANQQEPIILSLGACRQDFVFCRGPSQGVIGACPVGELLDSSISKCLPTEDCGVVSSTQSDVPLSTFDIEATTSSAAGSDTVIRPMDSPVDPCFGLPDGPLSHECSPLVIRCQNGISKEFKCPGDLVFDSRIDLCNQRQSVPLCGTSQPISMPTTTQSTMSDVPNPSCSNRANAGYALDCLGGYVLCFDGRSHLLNCQEGLVFDEATQSCNYPAQVRMCNTGQDQPVQVTTSAAPLIAPQPPVPSSSQCSTRSNGGFALDCAGSYVLCFEGNTHLLSCQEGLVFNEATQACDYASAVQSCRTSASNDVPIAPMPTPVDYVKPQVQPQASAPATAFCFGKPDGPLSSGCSATYVFCINGEMQKSMNCPVGTWFDNEGKRCDFKENILACGGSGPNTIAPEVAAHDTEEIFIPTTSSYEAWKPESTESVSSYNAATVAPSDNYNKVPAEDERTPVTETCVEGRQPIGHCSPAFTMCSNGMKNVMVCASPLVFDEITSACLHKEFVQSCEGFHQPTYTEEPSTLVGTTASSLVAQDVTSSEDDLCDYSPETALIALSYCSNEYAICTEEGRRESAKCILGELFDIGLKKCVAAADCGHRQLDDIIEKIKNIPAPTIQETEDRRCAYSEDGSLKPLGRCRSTFIQCVNKTSAIRHCHSADYFSPSQGGCISRASSEECSPKKPRLGQTYQPEDSSNAATFCRSRHDDLYRNPSDCSGIVQCFGGDLYEHLPCTSGLVFNEHSKKCDYRSNVATCNTVVLDVPHPNCSGTEHGAFLPHESDCKSFYRCVWERLELMQCPTGTVFNPALSVCDWPQQVPQCR